MSHSMIVTNNLKKKEKVYAMSSKHELKLIFILLNNLSTSA